MPLGYERAASLGDAISALAADPGARFLGGGTILMRIVNQDDGRITRLVAGDRLGLAGIEVGNGKAVLGAAVTMAAIAAHKDLTFLAPVALSIGGPAVRNMATVGGNLFARAPYGDMAVALLALGAAVTVEGPGGSETIDLETFLSGRGRKAPRIVQNVTFNLPGRGAFRFAKAIRKKPHGAAVVAIAALLPVTGGKVDGARVAYGAMAEMPIRARAVERALEGKALDAAGIDAATKVAGEGTSPPTDPQASAWYRAAVLPVHLKRLLLGETH
ncbi:MAG TPA: FAD binding domain-containing protein [Bauldia sp.]|nr:FAD binding domain-containing protein [Bauldia sp.]